MPNMARFLDWGGKATNLIDQNNRAIGIDFMAGMHGQSITLTRGNTTLTAQTVVVAPITSTMPQQTQGPAARTGTQDILLIGPRNHPTLSDFNVQVGDRFAIGTARYEVKVVDTSMLGKTEARGSSIQ